HNIKMHVVVLGKEVRAHLNAAITITHCVLGKLSWKKLPFYVLGQFLGSFLASATVFGIYYGMGNFTVTGPNATAGLFSTYPAPYMSLTGGFFVEVSGDGCAGSRWIAIGAAAALHDPCFKGSLVLTTAWPQAGLEAFGSGRDSG
uniref:Uncharacterized protein n=1 Tax=Nothoprocta perdicaria TaxID=30464 RepID=A0A8C6Z2B3_NOTPE